MVIDFYDKTETVVSFLGKGRIDNTGSLKAKINSASSNSWRKNSGGNWIRPQGLALADSPASINSSKLENARRWGLRRIRYGISNSGSAKRPNRAVGLRNSIGLFKQADGRQSGEDEVA